MDKMRRQALHPPEADRRQRRRLQIFIRQRRSSVNCCKCANRRCIRRGGATVIGRGRKSSNPSSAAAERRQAFQIFKYSKGALKFRKFAFIKP